MIHRQGARDALLHRRNTGRLPVATSVQAKDDRSSLRPVTGRHPAQKARSAAEADTADRPLLLVDIDGVISLFAFEASARPDGSFHAIDGIPHFLSSAAAEHLLALAPIFELVWASGWEEKANEYLPHLLGVPALPHLSFKHSPGRANAHWKLDAIDDYAGSRPLAWIDDAFNEACHEWAQARPAPTLLVKTEPATGLTEVERVELVAFSDVCRSPTADVRRSTT
jgi:HAD domain in Swiss Army Knife RNA repair proteins